MSNTVSSLLADAEIKVRRAGAGSTEKTLCPQCGGGQTREISLSVTIDQDGSGFVAQCHRGSCGWREGKRIRDEERRPAPAPAPRERPTIKPALPSMELASNRPDWLYDFFTARNIGAKTVNDFGVYAVTRRFPSLGDRPAMVFPYVWKDELRNNKYRPHPDKNPQLQERDALPTMFNIDRVGETIVIVEGEPDVMALYECGIPYAVTLKDGAPSPGQKDDKRYAALGTHSDILEKAKQIILAGDMDAPGLTLREELARRLGRHRCWLVTWPDGCKDACDTLKAHGPDAVTAAIKAAEAYPIKGIQDVRPGLLRALRETPAPTTMRTGCQATDDILHLPTEGRTIIVTGIPSHGKSSWTRFVMIHTAKKHDRRWAVFSPEMQPWQQFVAQCAEVYTGKKFWEAERTGGMTEVDVARSEEFLNGRVTMISSDAEDVAPTLEWILDLARAAVLRNGITDLLIDPWNEVEHSRVKDMTETEYIGRALQKLKAFGMRHSVNVWIIVHPVKPSFLKTGEHRPAPGPYDLSGSAHWANKADVGITVHSPEPGEAEVHIWKCRFGRWGVRGKIAKLDYNGSVGIYSTPVSRTSEGRNGAY